MLQNNKNYPHSLQNRDNQKYKSPPKNHKKTLQVKSITTDNNFINQESFSYQKHTSDKKFMLISKEIGYFNKITKILDCLSEFINLTYALHHFPTSKNLIISLNLSYTFNISLTLQIL